MGIKVHQASGLTATMRAPGAVKGASLTHAELDSNFNSMWPIGSIYINVSSNKNPKELMGFGEWESFGETQILVGHNDSPAGFDTTDSPNQDPKLAGDGSKDNQLSKEIKTIVAANGELGIEFYSKHNFSKGQRVTISGIVKTSGTYSDRAGGEVTLTGGNERTIGGTTYVIDPNGEKEILHLGNTSYNCPNKAITVRYVMPPPAGSGINGGIPGPSGTKTKLPKDGTVTFFGTSFNSSPVGSSGYNTKRMGTGGFYSHALSELEIPEHKHIANWIVDSTDTNFAPGDSGYDDTGATTTQAQYAGFTTGGNRADPYGGTITIRYADRNATFQEFFPPITIQLPATYQGGTGLTRFGGTVVPGGTVTIPGSSDGSARKPFPPIPSGGGAEFKTSATIFDKGKVDAEEGYDGVQTTGAIHNNMMPFITGYFWRRKA